MCTVFTNIYFCDHIFRSRTPSPCTDSSKLYKNYQDGASHNKLQLRNDVMQHVSLIRMREEASPGKVNTVEENMEF